MKTQVTTETGRILDVEDIFENNGKGGYCGEVIINGEKIHTYWYFVNNEVSFLTSYFYVNGEKYYAKGKVSTFSKELKQRLDDRMEAERRNKEKQEMYKRSQMFDY